MRKLEIVQKDMNGTDRYEFTEINDEAWDKIRVFVEAAIKLEGNIVVNDLDKDVEYECPILESWGWDDALNNVLADAMNSGDCKVDADGVPDAEDEETVTANYIGDEFTEVLAALRHYVPYTVG